MKQVITWIKRYKQEFITEVKEKVFFDSKHIALKMVGTTSGLDAILECLERQKHFKKIINKNNIQPKRELSVNSYTPNKTLISKLKDNEFKNECASKTEVIF